jgi:hypothetical protein
VDSPDTRPLLNPERDLERVGVSDQLQGGGTLVTAITAMWHWLGKGVTLVRKIYKMSRYRDSYEPVLTQERLTANSHTSTVTYRNGAHFKRRYHSVTR